MSLAHFHVFLISAAVLLGGGLGFWGLNDYSQHHCMIHLWMGIFSFGASAGLGIYLGFFLRKLKKTPQLTDYSR